MKFNSIFRIVRWLVALFFSSTILVVVAYRFIPVYVTPLMVIRCFQQVAEGREIVMHHHWISLDRISPHLPVAVMASEDQRFLLHHGFDFDAIEKAVKHNKQGMKTGMEQVRYHSKRLRMCFFGLGEAGREKDLRRISLQ